MDIAGIKFKQIWITEKPRASYRHTFCCWMKKIFFFLTQISSIMLAGNLLDLYLVAWLWKLPCIRQLYALIWPSGCDFCLSPHQLQLLSPLLIVLQPQWPYVSSLYKSSSLDLKNICNYYFLAWKNMCLSLLLVGSF